MSKIRIAALTFFAVFVLLCSFVAVGLIMLDRELSDRFEKRTFLAPTTYWALPESFEMQSVWSEGEIDKLFAARKYTLASSINELRAGTYFPGLCPEIPFGPDFSSQNCYFFRTFETLHPELRDLKAQAFAVQETGIVTKVFRMKREASDWEETREARLSPRRVAQFVGGQPLLQEYTPLGEIPPACPNAVLAIEDPRFFEHAGINWRGLARAFVVNVISARFAQGGSTITQQMVKNFFLNSEKTLSRKLKELGMALLLESKLGKMGKDRIFETYLNIIYLGQTGPFQIRGYSAAARHYFQKPLQDLRVPECALLAAVLNSPGLYDPFRHPERSMRRRNLVLSKMKEFEMISDAELQSASEFPMPKNLRPGIEDSSPYFIEAVHRDLADMHVNLEGLNVFTTMNLEIQEAAQKNLVSHLQSLEQKTETLKNFKTQNIRLEGIALTIEVKTGRILAAVGGRGFRTSPFNRILDGKRQIGSLAKPFVFLSAFESDATLSPLSVIPDEKTTYKLHRQEWTPENYNKKFAGEVTLGYALKNSLNAATAALGMKTGIDKVAKILRKAGVQSPLDEVPSLTLGAADLKPIEMAESYLTLARLGGHIRPYFFEALVESGGDLLAQSESEVEQVFDPTAASLVVGMMKHSVRSGTAAAIGKAGFAWSAAGKTGTTSDYRDAWFVGFTPWDLTLIWIGYDQNQSHGLTGSSGAVPVWLPVMEVASRHRPKDDFSYPETVKKGEGILSPDLETTEVLLRTE